MKRRAIPTIKELLGHLDSRRKQQLAYLILLMLMGAVAELISIGAVVPFVASIINGGDLAKMPMLVKLLPEIARGSEVLFLSVSFGVVILVASSIRLSLLSATNHLVFGVGHDVGVKLYEVTLNRPYEFHSSKNSSEILGGINKVQIVANGYLLPLMNAATSVVLSAAIVLAMIIVEPRIALIGGGAIAIFYLTTVLVLRRRLSRAGRVIAKTNNARIQVIQEGLGGIRDIILDRAQKAMSRKFSFVDSRFRNAQATSNILSQSPRFILEGFVMLLVTGYLTLSSERGTFSDSLPALAALALGVQRLLPLAQQIYNGWSRALSNQASADDVLALMRGEIQKKGSSRQIEFNKSILLDDISFSYVDSKKKGNVIEKFRVEIPKGAMVGVVGRTGSGKSTLIDLILGLLRPSGGSILVDGIPLSRENIESWQSMISHVPQSIFLADSTIARNIAFRDFDAEINMQDVVSASKIASIHDDISLMPRKYEELTGENGARLSGGQRQRIGIARALYKNAKVLILDEATSALDERTEELVLDGIRKFSDGKTLIMVSHRPTTLKKCDFIIQLDGGICKVVSPAQYFGQGAVPQV